MQKSSFIFSIKGPICDTFMVPVFWHDTNLEIRPQKFTTCKKTVTDAISGCFFFGGGKWLLVAIFNPKTAMFNVWKVRNMHLYLEDHPKVALRRGLTITMVTNHLLTGITLFWGGAWLGCFVARPWNLGSTKHVCYSWIRRSWIDKLTSCPRQLAWMLLF